MLANRIARYIFTGFLLAPSLLGASPELALEPGDLPRVPATPPDRAVDTFRIKAGFKIELVAAEPLIADPIAICFDENSRMFAVEMRDYSERRDERLGRIRLLEDTDGDGRMDKSTIFAEGLPWPTALFWYDGGLFVGSTPNVYYFRDNDGDGRAEERRVVYTGFGSHVNPLNVQALLNSFRWSLDNRIHGATSFNGGVVECPEHPEYGKLSLRGRDFSFDPKTLRMRAESGGGQYGLTFDNYGRKFICSNSSHIRQVMYELRYLDDELVYPLPPAALDIPADGAAAEVYRLSPEEPWRVIRTKWRVAGLVPGPIEGGGRSSGYFTSASGLCIYRGTALGEDFVGDEFVADVGSNLVHRKKLRRNGVPFLAERPGDEQKVEFLASTDNWFRPVQIANAPDGALYIVDIYRETIEHPWSLPPNIKEHLDLNSGNDRGRIYRIVPADFEQPRLPRLGTAPVAELVKTLEHPNGWHRDTAARLLYERQDESAASLARDLARSSKSPLGRLHALGVLRGLGGMTPADLIRALADREAGVRENAVRWSEPFLAGESESGGALWSAIKKLTSDPDPRVRYQLAWTLGLTRAAIKWELLADLLRSGEDPWLKHAVLASSSKAPARVWLKLEREDRFSPAGRELLELAGRRQDGLEMRELATELEGAGERSLVRAYSSLARGGRAAGRPLKVRALPLGSEAIESARGLLEGTDVPPELAIDAVSVIRTEGSASREILLARLDGGAAPAVQTAVIAALSEISENELAGDLASRWERLPARVRTEAIDVLLKRASSTKALLEVIASRKIAPDEVPLFYLDRLRTSRDAEVRRLSEEIFGVKETVSAEDLMAKYSGALKQPGSPERGKAIFAERCASCHRFRGEGFAVGPDFETIQQAGRESALVNIIDPNREVAPRYISFEIETKDGESHSGVIAQETPASITLSQANGQAVEIPRGTMTRMHSSGKSLMPEGLEQGLTTEEMAGLLEYILP